SSDSGPKRQASSIEIATASGTASHSQAHGDGVSMAPAASSASSSTARSVATARGARGRSAIEITGERQQRQHARALDRRRQLFLMTRAGSGHAARNDLAAVGHEPAEPLLVLVVDEADLLEAELAILLLREAFGLALRLALGALAFAFSVSFSHRHLLRRGARPASFSGSSVSGSLRQSSPESSPAAAAAASASGTP